MSATRVKRKRHQVTRVYLVACIDCNEFTRDLHDEPVTLKEAEQAMREHEEEYHADD